MARNGGASLRHRRRNRLERGAPSPFQEERGAGAELERTVESKKAAEAAFTIESATPRPSALVSWRDQADVGFVVSAAGAAAADFDP